MEAQVRATLRQLILDHGRTLGADPRRCEAMLKDYCGVHRREIAALIVAQKARVATDLLGNNAGVPAVLLINRLVQRLLDEHPMTEEAARWAVESWALALGVIDASFASGAAPAQTPTAALAPPAKGPAVHTAPKAADPDPPDIHGWPAERVQALQKQAAAALGTPVVFRDRLSKPVSVGEQRGFFGQLVHGKPPATVIDHGPEMVVIPAGSFLMGSPEDEEGRNSDEGPQHRVTFTRPFAIGRYAVTFEEYDAFCAAARRVKPVDLGLGRGRLPVINVSWKEAVAYCRWLSEQIGKPYRLPSEAEWEYAARAGTATPFHFGATRSAVQAIYDGNHPYAMAAGSLPANPYGLHEVYGRVFQWVQDCWHETYRGAPADGAAWQDHCPDARRVIRGGTSYNDGGFVRVSVRLRYDAGVRDYNLGLRLAQDL